MLSSITKDFMLGSERRKKRKKRSPGLLVLVNILENPNSDHLARTKQGSVNVSTQRYSMCNRQPLHVLIHVWKGRGKGRGIPFPCLLQQLFSCNQLSRGQRTFGLQFQEAVCVKCKWGKPQLEQQRQGAALQRHEFKQGQPKVRVCFASKTTKQQHPE